MDVRRLLPIGAVVTALLVVAGIASHGRPLRPGVGTGPSATFFDYVATTSLLFAILMVAVVAYALRTERVGSKQPRSRLNIVSFALMIAASAILAGLLTNSKFEKRLRALEQKAQHHAPPQAAGNDARPNVKNARNARIRWDEIAIVLVLVGGIGVYLYMTRDARRSLRPLQQRRRTAVTRALDDSIDDLRRDPDLRRAIVAAYARMEAALADAGIPRAPAEAPYEYLERSLVELEAGGDAARRLTDLFQRAKFSHHEPAESMRDEAIDALVAVRDDLRRPVPEPVPT
jgi:ABC-type nickel/cobalt efflux system permease component RcnA